MTRRFVVLLSALMTLFCFSALPAAAGEKQNFDPAAFAAAKKEGKSILVHVHAGWCPTCKAQQPILEKLAADPAYKDVVIFEVDFDNGGQTLKDLNVQRQSTLIGFKGEKETG